MSIFVPCFAFVIHFSTTHRFTFCLRGQALTDGIPATNIKRSASSTCQNLQTRDLVTVYLCYLWFNESTFYQFVVIFTSSNIVKSLIFVVDSFSQISVTYGKPILFCTIINTLNHWTRRSISFKVIIFCLKSCQKSNREFSAQYTETVILNNPLRQITTYYIHHWCCETYVGFW